MGAFKYSRGAFLLIEESILNYKTKRFIFIRVGSRNKR